MVDDLRPALHCFGDETAITPNIDRLAARGTTFRSAYCQQAVCSPSRLSMLTGRRPDSIRVWDLSTHFRAAKPHLVAMPQLFRENGYTTESVGKIYHGSGKPSKDPPSWSVEPKFDYVRDPILRYASPENLAGNGLKRDSTEAADAPDSHYVDGKVCENALASLDRKQQSHNPAPFFLAIGFRKPHLPFCAPRKYWELYERDEIPLPANGAHPKNAPELATRSWRELEGYRDIPKDGQIDEAKIRQLRHGYYACVSYVDALIGRLLKKLESTKFADNTVVVLCGDHGYHLGEQGLWTKANNFELSTCVPLIIAAPSFQPATTDALVEMVDIYPTLAQLCKMAAPSDLEGRSLVPLLQDPNQAWKSAVFSQYPRQREGHRHRKHGEIMGYAVRTKQYRYVQWQEWDSAKVIAKELYDHNVDAAEAINVADDPVNSEVIVTLEAALAAGFSRVETPVAAGANR